MGPTNLISATEFTQYAPDVDLTLFGGASSPTVSGIISQATASIVNYCNVNGFDYQTETNETDRVAISPMGELFIDFRRRPVVPADVSNITLVKGGFQTQLVLTDTNGNFLFQIPYPGNHLNFASSYLAAAGTLILGGSTQLVTMKGADVFYKVTYTGGYSGQTGLGSGKPIPPDLKAACVLWVRDILATQFNSTGAFSFGQGSYNENLGPDGESKFIKRAKLLISQGGHRRMTIF